MTELEEYYNKFNEDKRLDSRHGQTEYITSMKYIREGLCGIAAGRNRQDIRIIDIGAGTGRYSIPLAEEGYDVTAVELVRHNLGRLKAKGSTVKAFEGNALRLKRFADESFDAAILFGPLYHLHTREEKLQALLEAKRVVKRGGLIFAAYIMNEYGVITYAFKERHILESLEAGALDGDFRCLSGANKLYSFVRTEDIKELSDAAGLVRRHIVGVDGAANYIRPYLNALDDSEFEQFIRYNIKICEREDLLGASAHIVDVLQKADTGTAV